MDLLASPITCTAWRARTMSDRPPLGCEMADSAPLVTVPNRADVFLLDGAPALQDHSLQEIFSISRNAGTLRNPKR
jgi:hypothetical protein